ncbi:MAG TPA: antibiotic biosynthesis monooxygenase [Anaerolineales bacterium]
MYVIIWEYQVRAERVAEFEEIYSPAGMWAKLFRKGNGYLGTELLAEKRHAHRYITIDRWRSAQDYESFLVEWKQDYDDLDAQCGGLTENETLLGEWAGI